MSKKKSIVIFLLVLFVVLAGFILRKYVWKPAPKIVYEVAVQARSQSQKDPVEDRKSSLKAGDVLVVQKDGHSWSNTEKTSYLILKMKLSDEQKQKLSSADERELTKEEKAERMPEDAEMPEEERKRMEEELEMQRETVRARAYRINLEELEFSPDMLYRGQPFKDQVFDWGIVEKKTKVK